MKYEEAKALQQQVKRSKECNSLLEKLQEKRKELMPIVAELEKSNRKEQSNLKRLQGAGPMSVFYGLIGKKDEKLNERKKEASVIKMKYESAERELRDIETEIRSIEEEVSQIMECEDRLHAYLDECYELLRVTKTVEFSEIKELEQKSAAVENKLLTVQETIALGKDLEWNIHNMCIILDVAEKTKADIRTSKVGSAATLYEYIDKAQTAVVKLEDKLAVFRKKLGELSIDAEIEVDVDAFIHVLDVPTLAMLDTMSTYFAIIDRVEIVSKEFRPIKEKLEEIMQRLVVLETDVKQRILDIRDEREDKIIEFVNIK